MLEHTQNCVTYRQQKPMATDGHSVASTYPPDSDEAFLRRCADGDEDGLRELTRRHQRSLYRFLLQMMGNEQDAEDATAELFVRVWKNAYRFQYRAKVSTWLYRIALNLARDANESRGARPVQVALDAPETRTLSMPDASGTVHRAIERDNKKRLLAAGLSRLRPAERVVLVLYYFEDRSYHEIQAITGYSYVVLKTRLARARQRLRAHLQALPGWSSD